MKLNQNLNQLIEDKKNLIKYYSQIYSQKLPNEILMQRDELEAEGYLYLIQLAKKMGKINKDFDKVFAVGLRRRYISFVRRYLRAKRYLAEVIELPDEIADYTSGIYNQLYYQEHIKRIKEMLSELAEKVFDLILDPNDQIIENVLKQYRSRRIVKRPAGVFYNAVMAYLGIDTRALQMAMKEIRAICRQEFQLT
ncbi:MAG: hypothetical protein DRP74_00405 [Candidatus Omnitrophota bacterium]|nr:MAG: hypothetical protein DRP74_00405 [Candidatus Omnitrophota bacterium]